MIENMTKFITDKNYNFFLQWHLLRYLVYNTSQENQSGFQHIFIHEKYFYNNCAIINAYVPLKLTKKNLG